MNRRAALAAGFSAIYLIASCADLAGVKRQFDLNLIGPWSGRLALRIESEPVQTFAALFDLSGTPETGQLRLTSPIGSTLAVLEWSPGQAMLKNGRQIRHFGSVDALIEAATGAAIPVVALFGWLAGRDEQVAGWRVDLSQISSGRLQATRDTPLPPADLRIVFEPA